MDRCAAEGAAGERLSRRRLLVWSFFGLVLTTSEGCLRDKSWLGGQGMHCVSGSPDKDRSKNMFCHYFPPCMKTTRQELMIGGFTSLIPKVFSAPAVEYFLSTGGNLEQNQAHVRESSNGRLVILFCFLSVVLFITSFVVFRSLSLM